MKKSFETGFTLVELMLVVAIIGALSAIAVPNVFLYAAKSKQSEVKSMLAALYSAEKSFYAGFFFVRKKVTDDRRNLCSVLAL